MFEVNATLKTFAGHKFYSETVLGEFCEAVLISSILYLKYPYWGERLLPDGRSCTRNWRKEVNVTFLKKCNDEQNNASWYQTFVIVQTDWFQQEIYVFLDSVFQLTREKLQADFKQQFLKRIPGYENMHEMHLNVSVHLKSYHLYHFHLFTFKIRRSAASS